MASNGELTKKAKSEGDNVQLKREIDALKAQYSILVKLLRKISK